jgi:hypothetical protein
MYMTAQQDERMMYLSSAPSIAGNLLFPPLLYEYERMAFDLQGRMLVLTTGDQTTQIIRLSPIDAHLMLPLLHFYPHYASDATLVAGYMLDMFTYLTYLRGEIEIWKPDAIYPLKDGIERLKKRIISLEMTIVRVRNTGYLLERCTHPSPGSRRLLQNI